MGYRTDDPTGRSRHWLRACVIALALGLATSLSYRANAQDAAATCAPAIGRLVSLQGSVEVQRAGSTSWIRVQRLDTSLCAGDRLRTGTLSRAALFLQPETLVRVDQNTTITLNQSNEEIEVEFFGAEIAAEAMNAKSFGAAYFITRFPKKFRVKTPHVNAAVEGTEFMVELSRDATKLTVVEGKVSSESLVSRDTQMITAGQSLSSGTAGTGAITTVVKPQDAVQWVLRYPPISDGSNASRAEELLRAGSVDEALTEIDSVLRSDADNSDALAIRAIIQVAKNEKAEALESAGRATTANLGNYRAWLAMSYSQQSSFNLEAALESALKAELLQSGSALAHARVAELYLSLGDSRRAEEAARAAVASDPAESHAYSMLGFVHLAQINTKAARSDFATAIERDSFSALPRLGLGLAKIRDGELVAGREELEVAVALDPSNSLLRSYVGKAYYEENSQQRDQLAAAQLELAQNLDVGDPTPWLYGAILKESLNRPLEALSSLQASSARNDNRAVYRSRLFLDDDAAARSSSVAAVYRNLGFEKLAIVESSKALADSPGNFSAHRQLAVAYSDLPRHDISRVSEALQAQIRQPVSLASVGPELGTDNLAINRNVGPARPGNNEFDAMFNRNDLRVQVDAIVGGLDTYGDQFVASVLNDEVAYTISQLHYETDGFSENDAARKDIYGFLIHGQVTNGSSLQLEAKRSDFEIGETFFSFDEFPFPTTLIEKIDTLRLSGHHTLDAGSDLIWSAVTADRYRAVRSFPDGGLFQSSNANPVAVEMQYIANLGRIEIVAGAGYIDDTSHFGPEQADERNKSSSAYGYLLWRPRSVNASFQFGLAAEDFESTTRSEFGVQSLDESQISPKIGVVWSPFAGTTLRAAAISSLHRPFIASQTIEPTQIAGFNQFFDGFEQFYGDFIGTSSDRLGVGLDQAFSPTAFGGVEWSERHLDVPSFVFVGEEFTWRENAVHAYWYKTYIPETSRGPLGDWQVALSAEVEYENVDRPQVLTGAEGIMNLDTVRVPIGIQMFSSGGLTIRLATTYVAQEGDFSIDVPLPVVHTDDEAWITDASLEYRLPRRMGLISIGVMNLFDESIELLEIDPLNPRVATKRFVFAKCSLTF